MRWRLRQSLFLVFVLSLTMTTLPAGADHNNDTHSANMTYEGTSPQSAFTNSDLAFWGNRVYAGNFGGFRVIDISSPSDIENPARIVANFSCPGSQFDVSVWNNDGDAEADLLFASVDAARTNDTCASAGSTAGNPDSWEGIRVFDINNLAAIQQIAAVPLDCGSHTHTLLPGPDNPVTSEPDFVYLYNSSYPLGGAAVTNDIDADATRVPMRAAGTKNDGTECLEPEPEPEGTSGDWVGNKHHNKISIVKVDLANPATADDRTPHPSGTGWVYTNVKEVALPLGGIEAQVQIGDRIFNITACHDIAAFIGRGRAVGSCWREAIIWDIADPFSPVYLRRIRSDDVDTLFHSVTFSWDGKVIALEDEAGGGGENRCKLEDGETDPQGSIYFYSLSARRLGTFKIPREATGICTAHNYNTIPLNNGRRVLVSAWYSGGTSVVDYTNPAKPRELGYYVLNSPVNGVGPDVQGVSWSSYWYNGWVYDNDIPRGLEVLSFTHNVLAGEVDLPFLNPQTQMDLIAQTYTFRSTIGIRHTRFPHVFRGRVGSEDARCVGSRTVQVKKVRSGPDRTVGSDTTGAEGRWVVRHTSGGAGRYYAVVQTSSFADGINTVVCKQRRSDTIRVRV
jgi:hypothetical protein